MKNTLSNLSKAKVFAIMLVIITAFFIHSCKKDILNSKAPIDQQEQKAIVGEAKSWFENAYPKATNNATLQVNSPKSKKAWYEGLSPDWAKAYVYKKGNESLIELPLYNSKVAFVPFNTDSSRINLANNYARTSYIISKDSLNNKRAWFMVLIADTAYINGNFAKLNLNTYKSRDKDFSGRLLYFTPDGYFLAGWRYQKGNITKTLSFTNYKAPDKQVTASKEVNLVQVCQTYPVTSVNQTCVTVNFNGSGDQTTCTTYYEHSYIVECYTSGGGDGNGGGSSGGGGSYPPPPPKPDCPPVAVESVNGRQINLLPGGGGSGGGSPCDVPKPNNPVHDENLIPKNKLCSSTFKFSTIVNPDASQNSRGWKEASVANLVINVVSDNYFENIWNVITTGSGVASGKFNLEIGVPGDIPDQFIVASTTWAANYTMVQLEKSYGVEGIKNLINLGTLGPTVARLMQIQLQ